MNYCVPIEGKLSNIDAKSSNLRIIVIFVTCR